MEAETRQVAQDLLKQLGGTLKAEIAASGPESAVQVCRDVAPKLAGQASLAKGWKVARVGTRTRNPLLGMPDAWEQEVLARFQQRLAAGEKLESMEFSQVVQEPSGSSFRYMKAIGMQPQCVACHGPQDQLAPGVKASLNQAYPHDQATGYTPGQLRGAVTIKRPI
jgi:mono/diheme cytochrome c family protein